MHIIRMLYHLTIRYTTYNLLKHGYAYMRQWTESTLVQVMACRLFGLKPLPEPLLTYCSLIGWTWNQYTHDDVIKWNLFRVADHLCREFTVHRWTARTKASDAELWCFFFDLRLNKRLSKQSWGWRFETPSRSLWSHCNDSTVWFHSPCSQRANNEELSCFICC